MLGGNSETYINIIAGILPFRKWNLESSCYRLNAAKSMLIYGEEAALNLSVMQEFVGKMVEFLDDMKDLKEVRKYESNKGAYNN